MNENGVPMRGYRQRLFREWQEIGLFESTEQRICDQARTIRKNGWLTELEIEVRKREISQEDSEGIIVQGSGNITADKSVDDDGIQQEQVERDYTNETEN